eukprot:GHUV01053729.1.p1 GENE.GHUV01053729.1~~GHUV01053729.1.p1  ORF type:complete len:163 (+),score=57.01 GHUV01053729.1:162-650(+)
MLQVYSYFESEMQPQLRTTLEDVQRLLAEAAHQQAEGQQVLILDTRSAAQYSAEVRRGPRGGHIPAAVSVPRPALLDPDLRWLKTLGEQKQVLQDAGVQFPVDSQSQDAQQRVLIYCNGGVAACTAALALHRLGHRNWAVYDGNWNEYSGSELPVAEQAQNA